METSFDISEPSPVTEPALSPPTLPPGWSVDDGRDLLSPVRQVKLLDELAKTAARRAALEAALAVSLAGDVAAPYREAVRQADEERALELEKLAAQRDRTIEELTSRCEAAIVAAEQDYRRASQETAEEFSREETGTRRRLEEGRWETSAMLDAARNATEGQSSPQFTAVTALADRLGEVTQLAERLRRERGLPPLPAVSLPADDAPLPRFDQSVAAAQRLCEDLKATDRHPALEALWAVPLAAALWVVGVLFARMALAVPILAVEGLPWTAGAAAAAIVVAVFAAVAVVALRKRQMTEVLRQLGGLLAQAEAWKQRCLEFIDAARQRQMADAQQRYGTEIARQENATQVRLEQAERKRDLSLKEIDRRYAERIAQARAERDRSLAELESESAARRRQLDETAAARRAEIAGRQQQDAKAAGAEQVRLAAERDDCRRQFDELVRTCVVEISQASTARFPGWRSPAWQSWSPPADVPGGIRFGQFEVDLKQIPGALAHDDRVRRSALASFPLPALVPFPSCPSLMYKAAGEGRTAAVASLQAVMLRLVTSLPAGKCRFTIIDPMGLGENFAGFMHLADYDESLVGSRIWTEPEHIERRLADLTEHLENVIQTYLRNQFETIEEYNRDAGEVAEPFRFLVVANFPAGFSEPAVKRLISIAASGPRCGVYVLLIHDTRQKLPPNCSLRDLERHCNVLHWDGDKFLWQHPDLGKFPLLLDAPPPADVFSNIVHAAGRSAKDANRVQVPFRHILPPAEDWWKGDSSTELDAALGKVGATKLQHLRLGRGTSQHVLIAGKTGSGKSTLLHVLITSLAAKYSPQELQFYLVDFKKGVEFKTYAAHTLPHARVVAVESEREFGLSVLQRLDLELKLRGEAFRKAGVQELAAYREAVGGPLPRVLLVVDEFQELFVEDDKMAQEAGLLLDRLVRQGRAFGIHVLLGSQTLGGAYSLARSTLGQMAVRIALECSETDASLILSDGNTAARLLSRPGEAIYNDANGRVEGNKPFQVAWLPDEEREVYLRQIVELAQSREMMPAEPQIVFEGNAPADPLANHLLQDAINAPAWCAAGRVSAWLGEPVAIKEPTAATFRRQGGSNLLIVGQREDAALAMLAMAQIGLAAQHPPQGAAAGQLAPSSAGFPAKFFVLDGCSADFEHAGLFKTVAEALPHPSDVGSWRDAPRIIGEIADELNRRIQENLAEEPAIYLFVHHLARFRDLRRDENDLSYGGYGQEEKPNPARQFAQIVREGAAVGIHVLVWCDTPAALSRVFDRQAMREFEQRVLFQMGPDDSSNLIDSPAAGRLGPYRALLHSDETGILEKFRPYQAPGREWIAGVGKQLSGRAKV
ncbi:MAG: AAA family ATPase [Planctomycetia bacterium]|nr:AAA family ATPase [Planctomycetia bacterium]